MRNIYAVHNNKHSSNQHNEINQNKIRIDNNKYYINNNF